MENEIFQGTITTELIAEMEVGKSLKLPSKKIEIDALS